MATSSVLLVMVFCSLGLQAQPFQSSNNENLSTSQKDLENALREHLEAQSLYLYRSEMREQSLINLLNDARSVLQGYRVHYYDILFDVSNENHDYFHLYCTLMRTMRADPVNPSKLVTEFLIRHRDCVVTKRPANQGGEFSSTFAMALAGFNVYAGNWGDNMLLFEYIPANQ
jgi:hypothetical protein